MESVFSYIDYRRFLADCYAERKASARGYSYRQFAQRAGIGNPVLYKLVADGTRNLTRRMADAFAAGLGLQKKEAAYFRHLVLFNQARTAAEKQEQYAVLRTMRGSVSQAVLGADRYDFYDTWYAAAVRELICMRNFRDDYAALAAAVYPAIKPKEAKTAVALLKRLGLVKRNRDGSYERIDRAVTTGEDITALAVRNFNRRMTGLAAASLDAVPRNRRHVSGITMGISAEMYKVVEAEIIAFKERLVNLVAADRGADRVYQFNALLFPVSSQEDKDEA